ncbi:WD40 repeat domain-containing protein [Ancylobacter terrae]|uniref:WD40 repeat domain-containing protein n=1 Tax=Ancylobacter sp. sgz301288 TaxID=3342077 RepID=UPI0038599D78
MEATASAVFALLARHWPLAAPATACGFDAAGASAAFALADGTVAIAPMADAESAARRWHVSIEDGRATLSPRSRPVAPLIRVPVDTGPLHLARFGAAGFLAGGASGRLAEIAADGQALALVDVDSAPVEAIRPALDVSGGALVAAGGVVTLYPGDGSTARAVARYDGRLCALAPLPGGRLALAHADAVLIVEGAGETRRFDLSPGAALAWSPDGRRLAVSLASGGIAVIEPASGRVLTLADYPAPVRALAWSADGAQLATAGAFRPIVWDLGGPEDELPATRPSTIDTGRAGFVAVETLARHPRRPLLALGFASGAIAVAPVGSRETLMLREPAGGALTHLAWSGDGEHLAFADAEGSLGVVDLPPQLFK